MKLVEITSALAGPFYAFPISQAPSFTNWASKRVLLAGSNGYFSGSVNTTLDGNVWLIFSGATQPTSFDDWLFEADFSNEDIPKFGDSQNWASPTNTLAVTVTRAV